MLTFSTSHNQTPASSSHTPTPAVWSMFPSSSIHQYDHRQCYITEPNRILEYSLIRCSATRKESFLLFTAYNIASEYLRQGQCQFQLGTIIPVSPFFSVSQPATVNSTEFQSTAVASFADYLGFSSCSGEGEDVAVSNVPVATVIAIPTASTSVSLTAVTSGPNQTSTQSISTGTNGRNSSSTQSGSTHSSGSYDIKVKVANGVAIPVASLGLVLFGFFVYKRRKAQKTLKEDDATSQNQGSLHEETQPYLQQKAELEAEENRKHELEARERRYEVGNEGERYELPVEEEGSMIQIRQELRGEEHSTELEVPL